jgi:hypothetical protein
VCTEPSSTKQVEDGVGWGLETDAETLIRTTPAVDEPTPEDAEAVCRQVRCPVFVVPGASPAPRRRDADRAAPHDVWVGENACCAAPAIEATTSHASSASGFAGGAPTTSPSR